MQNALSKVSNTTTAKSISTAKQKTKSIWNDLTAGAGYALSGGTSIRNEPQKTNNYTPKYTNGESKITSFLNSNRTDQTKSKPNDFWNNLTAGSGYYNSGGMSAVGNGNAKFDISKPLSDFANKHDKDLQRFYNAGNAGLNGGVTDYIPLFSAANRLWKDNTEYIAKNNTAFGTDEQSVFEVLGNAALYDKSGGMSNNLLGNSAKITYPTKEEVKKAAQAAKLGGYSALENMYDAQMINTKDTISGLGAYNGTPLYLTNMVNAQNSAGYEETAKQALKEKIAEQMFNELVEGMSDEEVQRYLQIYNITANVPAALAGAVNPVLGALAVGLQSTGRTAQNAYHSNGNDLNQAILAGQKQGLIDGGVELGFAAIPWLGQHISDKTFQNNRIVRNIFGKADETADAARYADDVSVGNKAKGVVTTNNGGYNGEKTTIISNLGTEVDITISTNHVSITNNPGPKGKPLSSIDILDGDGNVSTRRWYDMEGNAYRDVDMTNHGNSKMHPEYPHEHTWEWSDGIPKRSK